MSDASSVFTGLGGGLSAGGQVAQGQENANVSIYNAQVANQNSNLVIQQSDEEARRSLVNSRKLVGTESAAYGASGVGNQGSADWVMRNSAAQGELNAMTIRNSGQIKANAYQNEANLDMLRASNASTSGWLGGAAKALPVVGLLATSLFSGGSPNSPDTPGGGPSSSPTVGGPSSSPKDPFPQTESA